MYGIVIDLDAKELEAGFNTSEHRARSEIEGKLASEGFSLTQGGAYLYEGQANAMEFALLVRRVFSTFRYARAVRDLRAFEVRDRSSLAAEIHEAGDDAAKLGKAMWP